MRSRETVSKGHIEILREDLRISDLEILKLRLRKFDAEEPLVWVPAQALTCEPMSHNQKVN